MKSKIVKRTWKNKKGEIKTKVYDYSEKYKNIEYKTRNRSTRTRYIITKTGKLNKSAQRDLLAKHSDIADDLSRKIQLNISLDHKGISVDRLLASFYHDRIKGMFANAGISIEDAAIEAKTSTEALLKKENWNNNIFENPDDGKSYEFTFNYTGAVFEEIKKDE